MNAFKARHQLSPSRHGEMVGKMSQQVESPEPDLADPDRVIYCDGDVGTEENSVAHSSRKMNDCTYSILKIKES